MNVITTVREMQDAATSARLRGVSIGCVPTMGSLHSGHASLIKASASRNEMTVVSVFVNPTQFGPNEDFDSYPRDLDGDVETIRAAGGTHIFAPTVAEVYPDGFSTTVHVGDITEVLEGAHRPGHFDGVSTIVSKLFGAMLPDVAYFGQKDLQQTLVVRRMVRDLLMPISISVIPTQREENGLAMSSRNVYLSDKERSDASVLYRALVTAADFIAKYDGPVSSDMISRILVDTIGSVDALKIEYAVAVDAEDLRERSTFENGDNIALLIAAYMGSTRLIDNMIVRA